MNRLLVIIGVAIILAVLFANLFSQSDTRTVDYKEYTKEELVAAIEQKQTVNGDFESAVEIRRLWRELARRAKELPKDERQEILSLFVNVTVEKVNDWAESDQIELLISINTTGYLGSSFRPPNARIVFPEGRSSPIDFENTSFQSGTTVDGSYFKFGCRFDLSQVPQSKLEQRNTEGFKLILTNEMGISSNPTMLYTWQVEYDL